MTEDERYEAYCAWCDLIRVKPAPPEIWGRTLRYISDGSKKNEKRSVANGAGSEY